MDYPTHALDHFEDLVFNNWQSFCDEFAREPVMDLAKVRFSSTGVEFVVVLSSGAHVVDGVTLGKFLEWVEVVE